MFIKRTIYPFIYIDDDISSVYKLFAKDDYCKRLIVLDRNNAVKGIIFREKISNELVSIADLLEPVITKRDSELSIEQAEKLLFDLLKEKKI